MRTTITMIGLFSSLLLGDLRQADAQRGAPFPGGASRPSKVHPAHEQAKSKADAAYQRGDYQRAIELTSNVLAQTQQDHVAYYLRGSARIDLGIFQGDPGTIRAGIADVREAIRHGGREHAIYYGPYIYGMTNLAAVENRKEHADVALQVAGQVLDLSGLTEEEQAHLHYQRAGTHAYLDNVDHAVADYNRTIRLSPKHLGAYMGLAEAYTASKQPDKARQTYDRAVQAFPDNPLVYNNRGMSLSQRGEKEEALADFTRAIQLDPAYFYSYTNRGFVLLQQNQPEAAEADFSESLKRNPNQPEVYNLRGSARVAEGKLQEAIADHEAAVRMAPKNPSSHAELGFARFFAGEHTEALESFNRAVELDPEFQYLAPWRCWVMLQLDQVQAARREFAGALDKPPEDQTWEQKLVAYLQDGLTEEQLLQAADSPKTETERARHCEAHYFIGLKQRQQGNADSARNHFEQALQTDARHLAAFRGAQFALQGP